MARQTVTSADGRLVFIGEYRFGDRYANAKTMRDSALAAHSKFNAERNRILRDENLSDRGKVKALNEARREFDAVQQRFLRGVVPSSLEGTSEALAGLKGVKARDKNDIAGFLYDAELRAYYKGVTGDDRVRLNAEMATGRHPELADAVLRMPDQVTGMRPDLRDRIEQHQTPPENRERVAEIEDRIAAYQEQVEVWNTLAKDLDRSLTADGVGQVVGEIAARGALEDIGLQRSKDGPRVEPFEAPEVEPLPMADDGTTIDLSRSGQPAQADQDAKVVAEG